MASSVECGSSAHLFVQPISQNTVCSHLSRCTSLTLFANWQVRRQSRLDKSASQSSWRIGKSNKEFPEEKKVRKWKRRQARGVLRAPRQKCLTDHSGRVRADICYKYLFKAASRWRHHCCDYWWKKKERKQRRAGGSTGPRCPGQTEAACSQHLAWPRRCLKLMGSCSLIRDVNNGKTSKSWTKDKWRQALAPSYAHEKVSARGEGGEEKKTRWSTLKPGKYIMKRFGGGDSERWWSELWVSVGGGGGGVRCCLSVLAGITELWQLQLLKPW